MTTVKKPSMLLVVGMQKSGTTILTRLLQQTHQFVDVGAGEADAFWGNVPSFTPAKYPCGTIYQKHQGQRGHEANAQDADARMVKQMQQRLQAAVARKQSAGRMPLNKNPYNVLRLPWLRKVFPNAYIVLIHRDAVANAFSLKKRYVVLRRNKPGAAGVWWGAKPRGWQGMVRASGGRKATLGSAEGALVEQISLQLRGVLERVAQTKHLADYIVSYTDLCKQPNVVLQHIMGACLGEARVKQLQRVAPLTCFDGEYKRGAKFVSQNKLSRPNFHRVVGPATLPPMSAREVDMVVKACGHIKI